MVDIVPVRVEDPNMLDQVQGYKIMAADFKLMIAAVKAFNGTPTIVFIRKDGVKQKTYITWAKYNDDLRIRWNSWLNSHQNTPPNYIMINPVIVPTPTPIPTPTPTTGPVKAYWVRSNLTNLITKDPSYYSKQGINTLMVSVSRATAIQILPQIIDHFKGTGIAIHAWMTCFKDTAGNWVKPSDMTFQADLLKTVAAIAKVPGISGIHFDYIRYPGTASGDSASITNFCMKARTVVGKGFNLSAAIMPETSDAQAYGQDPAAMAKYLDFLCPMIYTCTYAGTNRDWISKMTAYFNSKAPGQIVAGICSYISDSNPTALTTATLTGNIQAAIDAGSKGFIIFREGISNYAGGAILGTGPTPVPIPPTPAPSPEPTPEPAPACYISPRIEEVHQPDAYTCGPTSSVIALYELGMIKTVAEMAKLEGTTTNGTGHPGLKAGIEAAAKALGHEVVVTFQRFVDVGWDGLGKIVKDPNVACIAHGSTAGWRSYYLGTYGHYVVPVEVCMSTSRVRIADPARDLIWYSFKEFKAGLDLISQPSLIIITKVK